MPDDGFGRWERRIWAVLGVLAPTIVFVGCLGIVVGLATGQNLLLVALDLMIAVVGGILLLLLRWR
jgi:hypothetical protein